MKNFKKYNSPNMLKVGVFLLTLLLFIQSCGDDDNGTALVDVTVNISGTQSLLDVSEGNEVNFILNLSSPALESVIVPLEVEGISPTLYSINPAEIEVNAGSNTATGTFQFTGTIDDDTEYVVVIKASSKLTNSQNLISGSGYEFTILNSETATPKANVSLWVPLGSPPQLYGYRSEIDGEVGEHPCRTNEFFAAPVFNPDKPNILGFNNPNPNNGTNIFDFIRIYAGENISSLGGKNSNLGSNEVYEFLPDEFGSKTGAIKVIEQEITVKRTGDLPDFKIGISGSGTYDENSGLINVTVEFDETDIGNGMVVRSYEHPNQRRPGGCSGD